MGRRIFQMVSMVVLLAGQSFAAELTALDTVVYRGAYEATTYDLVFYRSARGEYWRRIEKRSDGTTETETRYSNLGAFRTALLGVDDYGGIMGTELWKTDADDDGYSDMLEYLTNGDPYSASIIPTEPRFLYFDGGTTFVPLIPVADMDSDDGGSSEPQVDLSTLSVLLERQEKLMNHLLEVVCYAVGLCMWRLAILSKSQRSIF